MKMNIQRAIDFLEQHGFMVRAYGFPESDTSDSDSMIAESYRVLQGDYDTGMIAPLQIIEVAEQIRKGS
ncbi:hypothetical protein OS242_02765 [Tumebacillus sp. DT12]|uniref:Uncharacterized protein n=1 Tax=Tumebacillus lacus TaxID=2995335 RepID=A0ABT3WZD6_9BACL|nr:hypothetical protein [Tumebacillus lacus]MCX7568882.1 hypothetical protein [Tumebacillus lacus]